MILIAPEPGAVYAAPGGDVFTADHRQILRDVPPEHVVGLLAAGCAPVPPVIVVHTFPEPGLSAHCHACGAVLEMPSEANPWEWLRKGDLYDFIVAHVHHAENLIDGWPRYPVRRREPSPQIVMTVPDARASFVHPGIGELLETPQPTPLDWVREAPPAGSMLGVPRYVPPPGAYNQSVAYSRVGP